MDAIDEAGKLYREAMDALREQRAQIEEDLAFSDPTDPQQWDPQLKRARESDPGGSRPCLVMDQLGQYIANVAGQIEQRPPALHAIPVNSGADKRVADKLDGFFRQIEHSSRAQQHYSRALTSAARAGVGYLVVRPEYTDRALGYQEPRISSEGDPLRVVLDPWSVELDGSDATFGFLLTPFSHREFERQFGKDAEKVSFGDDHRQTEDDDRESVLVAEMWNVEEKRSRMLVVMMGEDEAALTEEDFLLNQKNGVPMQFVREYTDKYRCVKWSRMSGAEVLTKETEFPADGIGIVPVYGYVGWSGGRMKYCGIARRARDPQRAYNYHVSEIRAYMQQAPKAPWIVPTRAIRGLEKLWDRASIENRAYLPYNDQDESGNPIAAPSRMPVAINLANHSEGLMRAKEDIQASIGMYQASLGAPSNETSGIAIESRKQQGEASTAHFPAHLAASIGRVGKLVMEMIPRLIDSRRQLRIVGIDETPGFVSVDPTQAQPVRETENGLTINPNVGKYDVRVVVGASFSTQRQQAQQAYTEMMRANPQMLPAIAPLWAQTLDVPHHDKLAQVLTAMAPEPVKAILNPEREESTAALKATIEQLQQALQEAVQHAQEATAEADKAERDLEALKLESASKEVEEEAKVAEVQIKAFEAETKRLQVLGTTIKPEDVQALTQQTIQNMMAQPDPAQIDQQRIQQEADDMQRQEVEALMQGQAALQEGQQAIAEALLEVARIVKSPRKRIPVRDKDGYITEVIDRVEDMQEGEDGGEPESETEKDD